MTSGKLILLTTAMSAVLGQAGCTRFERWAYPPPENAAAYYENGEPEYAALPPEVAADLNAGEERFAAKDYSSAQDFFGRVAEDESLSPVVAEKARYYEAEAYRMNGELPRAMRTYNRLLQDFPTGSYRTDSCGRMYQIANYWLSDLRDEIKQEQEKERGERSMVIPAMVHFEKGKPFLDSEGNALEYLEALHYADPTGPYADKSLWLLGYVNFYRGNFDDADLYLSQLNQHYPNSELRPASVKLAIMAKNSATGGPDYDGAKTVEAIKLIHAARTAVPELANDEGNFLDRQLVLITHQQAMKDFNVADFYQRTGHPGSAYFYYEIVRRRYPGTRLAELSKARMTELRKELDDPNRQRDVTGEAPASSGGINVLGWLRGTDRPVTAEQGEGPEGSTPLPPPRVAPTEPNVPQEFLPN